MSNMTDQQSLIFSLFNRAVYLKTTIFVVKSIVGLCFIGFTRQGDIFLALFFSPTILEKNNS